MHFTLHLIPYLQAIGANLIALLSGIGSIVFLTISFFVKEQTPRWVTGTVALLCFVVASGEVWSTEYDLRAKAERDLDALTKPQLSASFEDMRAIVDGKQKKDSVFTGTFGIKNLGAPSIVRKFSLTLLTPNGQLTGRIMPPPHPKVIVKFSGDDDNPNAGEFVTPSSYQLELVTSTYQIQTNGQAVGFLQVRFLNITPDAIFKAGNKLRLTFVDARDTSYSFEHNLTPADAGQASR